MATSQESAYARLREIYSTLQIQFGSDSRGLQDYRALEITPELLSDIRACIDSTAHAEVTFGLFTLKGIMLERELRDLPSDFRKHLIARIGQLLDDASPILVAHGVEWLINLRDNFGDYRHRMMSYLASENISVRKLALRYYETYALKGEFEPLLAFRGDKAVSESRPLGPWDYMLRNAAFELIEAISGRRFPRRIRDEPFEDTRVRWIDWSPVFEWCASRPNSATEQRAK